MPLRGARGGPVLWLLSAQYFAAQAAVASAWSGAYSLASNTISDLGNTRCARYSGRSVCSPLHTVMNASFVLLGLTMLGGALLIGREGGWSRSSVVGLWFIGMAGGGTVLVGLFPENTIGGLHVTGAALAFVLGNLGVLVLGISLAGLPPGLRWFTIAAGTVGLGGLVLFLSHIYLGLGVGGMERVAGYPQDLWLVVVGLHLLRRAQARRLAAA